MKISQFSVTPYSIPFVKPLQTSGKIYTHRDGIWLQLQWEDYGGVGEAAPLEGFSRENIKEVHYALEGFKQSIDGESLDREDLLSLVHIHTEDIPSARFALETAVFDLLAQAECKPMSIFLNPHAYTEIAVNGIAGIHMPGDGFKVMKVKVGFRDLSDETQHMVMLTKSFGEDTLFRLDANGSFNLTQAIRFCKEMEAFNIDYIEQPLPVDNIKELPALRHNTDIPIALDESLTDFNSAEKIIKMQAADIFVIKPMVSGGFTECKKIIDLAKAENIRTVITSSIETSIGRTACLHLAAANEIIEPCGFSTGIFLNYDAKASVIDNGLIRISDIPGMGMEI